MTSIHKPGMEKNQTDTLMVLSTGIMKSMRITDDASTNTLILSINSEYGKNNPRKHQK